MTFWNCFLLSSEKIQLALRNTSLLIADVSNTDLGRATHLVHRGLLPMQEDTHPIASTVTRQ